MLRTRKQFFIEENKTAIRGRRSGLGLALGLTNQWWITWQVLLRWRGYHFWYDWGWCLILRWLTGIWPHSVSLIFLRCYPFCSFKSEWERKRDYEGRISEIIDVHLFEIHLKQGNLTFPLELIEPPPCSQRSRDYREIIQLLLFYFFCCCCCCMCVWILDYCCEA